MQQKELVRLKQTIVECRRNVMRMFRAGRSGHLGPAYSCMDIVATLYYKVMNIDPKNVKDPDRDRFLLSAGHKCLAQYAVLAERGFFDKEVLDTYGAHQSVLPGHPDMHKLPGIEASTGSLGHGLGIACGMAMALKRRNSGARVYVVTGDGELAEGTNWEAAAVASHYKLDNLVVFVDRNTLQISGRTWEVMDLNPIGDHFAGFGWAVKEIDGNSPEEILAVCDQIPFTPGKPNLIVAKTIKGKGFAEAEDTCSYHYWNADDDGLRRAEAELAEEYVRVANDG